MEELLREHADVSATDEEGRSALHFAARGGFPDCVRLLLAAGVDLLI